MGHVEKPEDCNNCGWETDELKECDAYARVQGDDEKTWAWLCDICRNTYAGNAYLYPRQYENRDVLAMLAWGINRVLAEIRGGYDGHEL
jgi:ribosomal protein L37AE/L43A